MDYVKHLREIRNREAQNIDGQPSVTPREKITIKITDEGYPGLPTELQFEDLSKDDLTGILRSYLNAHYSTFNLISKRRTLMR